MALRMDGHCGHQLGKRQPGKKGVEGFVDGCGRKRDWQINGPATASRAIAGSRGQCA